LGTASCIFTCLSLKKKKRTKKEILFFRSEIVEKPNFHNDKYIWPVGFKSRREYTSSVDVNKRCTYICEILDGGDRPLFEVMDPDDSENSVKASSASSAWKQILERINTKKTSDTKRSSVSGPEYFGFGLHQVAELISKLPGAEKCTRYSSSKDKNKQQQQPAVKPLPVIPVAPVEPVPARKEDTSARSGEDAEDSDDLTLTNAMQTSPSVEQKSYPQTLNMPTKSSFKNVDPNLYLSPETSLFMRPLPMAHVPGIFPGQFSTFGAHDYGQSYFRPPQIVPHNGSVAGQFVPVSPNVKIQNYFYKTQPEQTSQEIPPTQPNL